MPFTAMPPLPHLTRRRLLVGAAVGGGLAVGWQLLPRRYPLPVPASEGESVFDAWLRIGRDGTVSVAVPQLEMGQGITTLIPQIVAMELGADWRHVAAQPVPVSEVFVNRALAARWAEIWMPAIGAMSSAGLVEGADSALVGYWARAQRFTATADGTALAAYEAPARAAAASARCLLAMAAAARWGVDWRQCEAGASQIRHGARRAAFADLAEAAAGLTPPDPVPLRASPPADDLGAGAANAFPRLDTGAKLAGSWTFAGDVRLPGMVYAAIRQAPRAPRAALVARPDYAARAHGIAGFVGCVAGDDWLAAAAHDWWTAERALEAIAPEFDAEHPADSTAVDSAVDKALREGAPTRLRAQGEVEALLAGPGVISRRYDVAPALHATAETATATALYTDNGWRGRRLELWVAAQAPECTRGAVAHALGMSLEDVVLYPVAAGGSFDARLETPHATQAALIAQQIGRPVQLIWSRAQEHLATPPRAPAAAVMSARTGPDGALVAWRARIAVPASLREMGRRIITRASGEAALAEQRRADPLAVEGGWPAYAIPAMALDHVPVGLGLATTRQRGNAHGYTAFFNESFLDEIAASLGREPLSFRMGLLGDDPRLAACLQKVSALAGWNGGRDGAGQGLACHRIGGGCIAAIVTARRSDKGVKADKISAVVDIGRIINLDIARQQVEGGLLFGLAQAIGAAAGFVQGQPTAQRLGQLGLPGLADCPEVEVAFLPSEADPADPGELGVAVAPPAIANALFSATGVRFRRLPLAAEE